jgi:hypothetical protein
MPPDPQSRSWFRHLRRSAAAVVLAAVLLPVAASASATASDAPRVLDRVGPLAVQPLATASWGGSYSTSAGPVTLFVSDSYPQDPALGQRWADFLASLIHGSELATVTTYLAPLDEVQRACGSLSALACYSPGRNSIIAPAEDPVAGVSAESILAHEYGHHVAASRDNSPWDAVDFGAKRWASVAQVCRESSAGNLFPGAQNDRDRYRLNPGEWFAESYRLLNERRAGRAETPWEVVDQTLYPNDAALAALEQDIVAPWSGNTQSTIGGSFTRRGAASRLHRIATPLDGTMTVAVRANPSVRVRIELLASDGSRVARTTVSGGQRSVSTTVCGTRSYRARVTRLGGAGAYRLVVAKP